MTAALLDRPGALAERRVLDGGTTLEELLSAALQEARASGSTECPVCRARMTSTRAGMRAVANARAGATPAVSADRASCADCATCGSRLS
jgi:hypothetical protein